MMWLVLALVTLFILLVIIILTKLTVVVDYYHGNDNDQLNLIFKIWFGLIRYKKEVPLIKLDNDSPSIVIAEETKTGKKDKTTNENIKQISKDNIFTAIHDSGKLLEHVVQLHKIVRNFLRKISIKQLEWKTVIGVGDAAYTGIATGGIWAVKGSIVGIISHYMKLKEMPNITVTPHFQQTITQTRFTCIIQFRIGQAMLAGLKLIKYWKGGRPRFKSKPLSVLSNNKPKSV